MAISIAVALHQPALPLPYNSIPIRATQDEEPPFPVQVTMHEVKATIIVKLTKPTKVASLSARFVSRQWLQDDEEDKCGTFGLFHLTKSILGGSNGDIKLMPAGLHTFETSFDVPSWLPPTFASPTTKLSHHVLARLETPSPLYFKLRRNSRVVAQELVVIREPPTALGALRYWSGERRSAGTSLAVKTARFARVEGKLKVSMRVKSLEQLSTCDVDIVQEESCCIDLAADSAWHKLPGSSTEENTPIIPFLSCQDKEAGTYNIRRYPITPISTTFPAPENNGDPDSATLSQLSLLFKVSGHELRPNLNSPLCTIRHKLRIKFRFQDPTSKEIVVNIPISLFEGPASCDDIPPLYEDIYNTTRRRSGASSVATLPLYVKDLQEGRLGCEETDAVESVAIGTLTVDPTRSLACGRCGPVTPTETTLGLRLSHTFTTIEGAEHSPTLPECLDCRGAASEQSRSRSGSRSSWIDSDYNMAPSVLGMS